METGPYIDRSVYIAQGANPIDSRSVSLYLSVMLSGLLFVIFRALRRWLGGVLYRLVSLRPVFRRRRFQPIKAWRVVPDRPVRRSHAKPAWVVKEVMRLAALTGGGCRSVEKLFNRLHASSRKMTVSKSFVHYTTRKHRYEIEVLRRGIKSRPPRPVPVNDTWGIDMTGKRDAVGCDHAILGIVDHGSRRLLVLQALQRQNAWTLLGHLFIAIGRYGVPRSIRSDNASVFRSKVFRWGCRIAGVTQQFSVPGCPWMNGRIERVFGTLKQKLDRLKVGARDGLVLLLGDFRFWYNAVRPHQNLGGLTPDEAWHGNSPDTNAPKSVHWFEAWDGLLRGYYLRC